MEALAKGSIFDPLSDPFQFIDMESLASERHGESEGWIGMTEAYFYVKEALIGFSRSDEVQPQFGNTGKGAGDVDQIIVCEVRLEIEVRFWSCPLMAVGLCAAFFHEKSANFTEGHCLGWTRGWGHVFFTSHEASPIERERDAQKEGFSVQHGVSMTNPE